jgi:hypothetical protein
MQSIWTGDQKDEWDKKNTDPICRAIPAGRYALLRDNKTGIKTPIGKGSLRCLLVFIKDNGGSGLARRT